MSRYINIDKVLKELHLNHKDVIYIDKNDTAKRIKKIPSIDIVFCKECKHKDEIVNYCYENDRDVNADDFCSHGERSNK